MAATTYTVNVGKTQQSVDLVQEKLAPQYLGGLRFAYFKCTAAGSGTVAATAVVTLPAGSLSIFPGLCSFFCSDAGASATLDVGYAAHTDETGTAVNAAGDEILDGKDISSTPGVFAGGSGTNAGDRVILSLNSQSGIDITVTVAGGDVDTSDILEGCIVYSGGTAN
jgi:hypothetical protein